ncbi:hypothetical protein FS749_002165, partial [Ceratobasidium sp. UAMH 11750]
MLDVTEPENDRFPTPTRIQTNLCFVTRRRWCTAGEVSMAVAVAAIPEPVPPRLPSNPRPHLFFDAHRRHLGSEYRFHHRSHIRYYLHKSEPTPSLTAPTDH